MSLLYVIFTGIDAMSEELNSKTQPNIDSEVLVKHKKNDK